MCRAHMKLLAITRAFFDKEVSCAFTCRGQMNDLFVTQESPVPASGAWGENESVGAFWQIVN